MAMGQLPLFIAARKIPTLVFHIDSETGVTSGGDGTGIDAISDQSGFGLDVTGTSPNRPVWSAGIYSAGTKHGIFFEDAATDQLNLTGVMHLKSGYSAFIVFDCSTVSAGVSDAKDVPFTIIGDTSATCKASFGLDGNDVAYAYNGTEIKGSGGTAANSNAHTIAVSHDTNGKIILWFDGVRATTSTQAFDKTNTGFNVIGIGFNAADAFNNGNIAEARVWSGAVNDVEVKNLHSKAVTAWF